MGECYSSILTFYGDSTNYPELLWGCISPSILTRDRLLSLLPWEMSDYESFSFYISEKSLAAALFSTNFNNSFWVISIATWLSGTNPLHLSICLYPLNIPLMCLFTCFSDYSTVLNLSVSSKIPSWPSFNGFPYNPSNTYSGVSLPDLLSLTELLLLARPFTMYEYLEGEAMALLMPVIVVRLV